MKFPWSSVPNKLTILRIFVKFSETGSVEDKKSPGCPSLLTVNVLGDPNECAASLPRKLLAKLLSQTGQSAAIVFRATKK